jgi:hypothetical protein
MANLRKLLKGIAAQIIPGDKATYGTVMNSNHAQQQRPVPQPPLAVRQASPQPSLHVAHAAPTLPIALSQPAVAPTISLAGPAPPSTVTVIPNGPPRPTPINHPNRLAAIRDHVFNFANDITAPIVNTAAIPVEAGRSAMAAITGNTDAERAAEARKRLDVNNSAPVDISRGAWEFGNALRYAPPVINAELHNAPIPNNAGTKGLTALNRSYLGPLLTVPEKVITSNIPTAADQARASGFNPKQSIALAAAQTAIGIPQALAPLGGLEYSASARRLGTSALDSVRAGLQLARDANVTAGEGGYIKVPGRSVPPVPEPATATNDLRGQIMQHYKGQAETAGEKQALAYVLKKPEKAMADYNKRVMAEFGVSTPNIVASDDAKFVVSGEDPLRQKLDGTKSAAYHEPASALAKVKLDQLLADPTTKDKPVLLMAGGSGAGKTSGLKQVLKSGGRSLDDYAAVIDTNSNALSSADSKIRQAVASGRKAEVAYVYRDPLVSFKQGVIPRSKKIGRIVPVDAHLNTHLGSNQVIHELAAKYKDDPNVAIGAVDNSGPSGSAKFVPVDQIPKLSYNRDKLKAQLERAVQDEQTLTDAERQTYLGTQKADLGSPGGQPQRPEPQQVAGNRLTSGGKQGRQNLSPDAQERISGEHVVRNTQQLQDEAATSVSKMSLDTAIQKAHDALAVAPGKIDDSTVAFAQQAIERADTAGRIEDAAAIHDTLSEHLVKNGQTIQAASLLYHTSPQGLLYRGLRTLKKAGVEITPKLREEFDNAIKKVKATKKGTPEYEHAIKVYSKFVADKLPQGTSDKLVAFWKAGLLTGIRTQTGNFLSNATFGTLHAVSNPLAVALDKAASFGTKQRTKSLTGRGSVAGTKEGAIKGATFLKSGIDERKAITNKFDQSEIKFKNPVLNTYVNGVFRIMGAADRPAYYAQLRNSLADLAKADGANRGLKGTVLRAHIDQFLSDPPHKAFQVATDEAEKAVLANETFASRAANAIRQAAGSSKNPLVRAVSKATINVVMPFTKVPAAFVSRVFDFTPVGAIKEAAIQASARRLDQRALVTAISEATTGTALVWLGMKLADSGLLSGNYPTDAKEQQRWKAEGIQPNSVKAGGTWLSMNYFGPVGMLFNAGGRIHDNIRDGGDKASAIAAATGGTGKDALGQSFLQGVSGLLDAINDPQRSAGTYVRGQAGSIVPTLAGDIATATDSKQRDTNSPLDAIKARIPGPARHSLPIKQDVFGNELKPKANAPNALANPLRPSAALSSPVFTEVNRLHDANFDVTPMPVRQAVTLDGVKEKLTDQERHTLQHDIGQATQDAWAKTIATPEYKALSDADKAKVLGNIASDIAQVQERGFAASHNLGQYAPGFSGKAHKLTRRQAALQSGFAAGSYTAVANGTQPTGQLGPKEQYAYNLSKFESDSKAGKLSDVQRYQKMKSLAREKVTSNYSPDVVSLYGLSKAELAGYMKSHAVTQQTVDSLTKLDQQLADNGVITKRKYRYGTTGSAHSAGRRKKASTVAGHGSAKNLGYAIAKNRRLARLRPLAITYHRGAQAPRVKRISKVPFKQLKVKGLA